jgi:outer membrane protein assembly factor BamB
LLLTMGMRLQQSDATLVMSGMAQSEIGSRIASILRNNVSRQCISRPTSIAIAVTIFSLTSLAYALRPAVPQLEKNGNLALTAEAEVQIPETQKRNVGPLDWPQWGGSSARNNTPVGERIPIHWELQSGKNIRWSAMLGSESYGGVIVANGKVYAGTNNGSAYIKRFPNTVDLGVLLCFDEKDGKFLWQHSNQKLETGRVHDWPSMGICSAPMVDGDRLWYVTNRGHVVCLDTVGFHDGENDGPFYQEGLTEENDADVVWSFDMMKLNVSQHNMANCSVTCAGDLLFVNTSHGVGESHETEPNTFGPSFICLSRSTGKLLWSDNSPSPNILHGQWSSPAYSVLGGVPQVIFGGGDGYVYGFQAEGENGKSVLLWKFDCNPKDSIYKLNGATRNSIIATPVIYDGLIYVAVGENPEHGEGAGRLWCIDPTKRGDVSPTLVYNDLAPTNPIPHKRKQALDRAAGDYEMPNTNSAAIWQYVGGNTNEFKTTMHRTCGTVAIQNDLLFVSDFSGVFHCVDAKSGKPHWTHDMLAACWSSPLVVDGRVYIGDEDGDVTIFNRSPRKELLSEINLGMPVYATPIIANNTLFIAGRNRLLAIQEGTQSKPVRASP